MNMRTEFGSGLVVCAVLCASLAVASGPSRAQLVGETVDGVESIARNKDGSIDCNALETSFMAVPSEVAAACTQMGLDNGPERGPTDTGYAVDLVGSSLVSFTLNDFAGQTTVGGASNDYYAVDFDSTATTLYAIDNGTKVLGTLSLADGAFTGIGACNPVGSDMWTGLTIDSNNVAWAVSTNGSLAHLYTVDLTTGTATEVTTVPGLPLLIDIAMDSSGILWGHDILADSIYTIDTTTGAETLIGTTGYDANYAQGMDFDYDDGTLYVFLYSSGTVFGSVDLATGVVTSLATHTNEFEGAIQTNVPVELQSFSVE